MGPNNPVVAKILTNYSSRKNSDAERTRAGFNSQLDPSASGQRRLVPPEVRLTAGA